MNTEQHRQVLSTMKTICKASDWPQLHLSAHCQCSYKLTWTGTECCCFAASIFHRPDFYVININRVIRKKCFHYQVVVLVPDIVRLFDVNEVNRCDVCWWLSGFRLFREAHFCTEIFGAPPRCISDSPSVLFPQPSHPAASPLVTTPPWSAAPSAPWLTLTPRPSARPAAKLTASPSTPWKAVQPNKRRKG